MVGFLDTLGQMFSGIAGGPDGVHARIWGELKPWFMNLGPAASRKWIPRIANGERCEVPVKRGRGLGECENIGIATCACCHKPCCLQHAYIDQHADAVCYVCVADALQSVPPFQRERARHRQATGEAPPREPPPRDAPPPKNPKAAPNDIAAALSTLGLRPGAKWDAVKQAHRRLSAANHPDKVKGARAKAAAEARFKEVQKAFEVLKRVYPEAQ